MSERISTPLAPSGDEASARNKSLACKMPIIFSISFSQNGIRVCGLSKTCRTISSVLRLILIIIMPLRCTMTSSRVRSFKSRIPPNMSRSPLVTASVLWCISIAPLISSCAGKILPASSALKPRSRIIPRAMKFRPSVKGAKIQTTKRITPATRKDVLSGFKMA